MNNRKNNYGVSLSGRGFGAVAFLAVLLLPSGCTKKKPIAVAPQAQVPTVTTAAPATQPPSNVQPQPNTQAPSPEATTAQPTEQQQKIATKPKPKHHNHVAKHNPPPSKPAETPTATAKANLPPATTPPSGAPSQNTVPQNNGQQEISVSMDEAQVARQKQLTEELLQSTDVNLKGINRTLNSDELAMVEQVRSYITQSRAATQDGDLIRASNLAQKAHLLSDALIKQR